MVIGGVGQRWFEWRSMVVEVVFEVVIVVVDGGRQ